MAKARNFRNIVVSLSSEIVTKDILSFKILEKRMRIMTIWKHHGPERMTDASHRATLKNYSLY